MRSFRPLRLRLAEPAERGAAEEPAVAVRSAGEFAASTVADKCVQAFDGDRIDLAAVRDACARQALRATAGTDDMASYLAAMVADEAHHEPLGPLLPGSGPSGVVVHRGWVVAQWGDAAVPEMLYSATKTAVSTVAGIAFDRGLLDPQAPVAATVDLPLLSDGTAMNITWQHLLQQTSQWDGELWGKPAWAAAGTASLRMPRQRQEARGQDGPTTTSG